MQIRGSSFGSGQESGGKNWEGQKRETFKTDKQKDFKHFDNINCVTVTMKIQLFIKSWSTKSKIILPPLTFPRVKCSALKNVARGGVVFMALCLSRAGIGCPGK